MSTIEASKIKINISEKNQAGIYHKYYNAGEKEIKYITFSYLPYNAVKDVVECEKTGVTEFTVKVTGPIKPKTPQEVECNDMWFNPTVATALIIKIHIQFMDNTEEVIEGKDVVLMGHVNSAYFQDIEVPIRKEQKEREEQWRREKEKNQKIETLCKLETSKNEIAAIILEFKDDEETLLKVLKKIRYDKIRITTKPKVELGYFVGDCVEKDHASNEKVMKETIALWKDCIVEHQKYQYAPFGSEEKDRKSIVQEYASKIKKYDPSYVMPKKAGCLSFGF